jgi:hypothetical protein
MKLGTSLITVWFVTVVALSPTSSSLDGNEAFGITHELPDGTVVEIVLLSDVAAYRVGLTDHVDARLVPSALSLYKNDAPTFKVENVPFMFVEVFSSSNNPAYFPFFTRPGVCTVDAWPTGFEQWTFCATAPGGAINIVKSAGTDPSEVTLGPNAWLKGKGCIKVYGGSAPEPIVIGSDDLFITGPLTTGGTC